MRVLVGDASAALKYYTEVLGMVAEPSAPLDAPGACVRIGAQVIELVELPNPTGRRRPELQHERAAAGVRGGGAAGARGGATGTWRSRSTRSRR